jgi:hypothetical protein
VHKPDKDIQNNRLKGKDKIDWVPIPFQKSLKSPFVLSGGPFFPWGKCHSLNPPEVGTSLSVPDPFRYVQFPGFPPICKAVIPCKLAKTIPLNQVTIYIGRKRE